MNTLSPEEKEIILDFYFKCGDQEKIDQGRDLVAAKPEAAKLYASLEATLTQLDSVKYEPCPDNLAELTIARLKLAAGKSQQNLENLLEKEQAKTKPVTSKRSFWRVAEIAAIAAMILLVAGIFRPATANMRRIARQSDCSNRLKRIGAGMASYAGDNNGFLPAVATQPGDPWWKIGDQGEKNQSNTRHNWLLVKNSYVEAKDFVCPGRKDTIVLKLKPEQLIKLNDFPSRRHVSYSFMFMCEENAKRQRSGKITVLVADLNPIFERVFNSRDGNYSSSTADEFARILVDQRMRDMTSSNHRGFGQNILATGGSAQFKKQRIFLNDDIYTAKDKQSYSGKEMPCNPDDIFLVP